MPYVMFVWRQKETQEEVFDWWLWCKIPYMTNVNGSRKPENPYEMEKSQTPTTVRSYGVAQYDYKVLLHFLLQINENFTPGHR